MPAYELVQRYEGKVMGVLVIARKDVESALGPLRSGFLPYAVEQIHRWLKFSRYEFLDRDAAEEDPDYKQLIPYLLIFRRAAEMPDLLTYWRTGQAAEARLHGKRSLGFGGHIDGDNSQKSPRRNTAHTWHLQAMNRELEEELPTVKEHISGHHVLGLVNDDSTPVGKVHLGVVHAVIVQSGYTPVSLETSQTGLTFQPADELTADLPEFERWSQLCLTSARLWLRLASVYRPLPPEDEE